MIYEKSTKRSIINLLRPMQMQWLRELEVQLQLQKSNSKSIIEY